MDHASIKDESLHSWSGLEWDNSRDASRIDSQISQTHTQAQPEQVISSQPVVSLLLAAHYSGFGTMLSQNIHQSGGL